MDESSHANLRNGSNRTEFPESTGQSFRNPQAPRSGSRVDSGRDPGANVEGSATSRVSEGLQVGIAPCWGAS